MDVNNEFTGEAFVPSKSGSRIEADHYARYEFAQRFVAGKDVLDIACGTGYAGPMMMSAGARSFHGVDISEQSVEFARSKFGRDNITFATGDVTQFVQPKSYDVITSFETIEHVTGYNEALRNFRATLRDGGTLLISSPNRPVTSPNTRSISDKPYNKYHTQEFTPPELIKAVEANGFRVSEVLGQRLRRFHFQMSKTLMRAQAMFQGRPDSRGNPEVLPLGNQIARYFVLVAS